VKLRTRILLVAFALSSVVLLPTGFVSWKFLTAALEEQLLRVLDAETALALSQIQSAGGNPAAQQEVTATLTRLSATLERRITVVSIKGRVLFDSDAASGKPAAPPDGMEMARAARTGRGESRRALNQGENEYLLVARRIPEAAPESYRGGVVRLGMTAAGLRAEEIALRNMLMAVGLMLVGLVVALTIPLSGWITRKLVDVEHTARLIASGAHSERATVESGDELGGLAGALNEMAEKLQRDIDTLQKLERVRSEFLGNVSHELRTPIFAIQGFVETLLDGAVDDPAVNREFLEKAYRQAERLNALLRDLIEISRIESGEMKMSFRYVAIGPFLRHIVDELQVETAKKPISLKLDPVGEQSVEVYADRDRLRQVMLNLVDNAIKYTDPGGSITVAYKAAGPVCEISVSDTGCGIAAEHIPRIFERFYRVDRDRSREVGGTGLGLAIVKHIVEAHGGMLRVESEVGKGSTFVFSLKL
jgi:two-component system, OmpR family, phosphate regulon sensor histidine kinase PhoR